MISNPLLQMLPGFLVGCAIMFGLGYLAHLLERRRWLDWVFAAYVKGALVATPVLAAGICLIAANDASVYNPTDVWGWFLQVGTIFMVGFVYGFAPGGIIAVFATWLRRKREPRLLGCGHHGGPDHSCDTPAVRKSAWLICAYGLLGIVSVLGILFTIAMSQLRLGPAVL